MKVFKLPKHRKGTLVRLKADHNFEGVVTRISEHGGLFWYEFDNLSGIGESEIEPVRLTINDSDNTTASFNPNQDN